MTPVSIAIADVNGDHKPDLIVVNGGSNTVGVLLGNGDGSFRPAVTYGAGGMFPVSVAVADVNGNGKLDLIVAIECADQNCNGAVSVLLGNGDGTFRAPVTYPSGGPEAWAVAIADVNRDGKPDLLVVNGCETQALCSIEGALSVLLGNGDGTFQSAVEYASGGSYPYALAVEDLNGDGTFDVVAANHCVSVACIPNGAAPGVLLGNGDGTFKTAVTYGAGTDGETENPAVAVADVNGDSRLDLLATVETVGGDGGNGGSVAVLLGNGDGTFQTAGTYDAGSYFTVGLAAADVNGDGRPDLLLANQCNGVAGYNCAGPINKARGTVSVLLNNFGAAPTSTSLVPSANPAAIDWTVTYTATVTPPRGRTTARGTVEFKDGFVPLARVALANNQAAYSTSYPAKGTHAITATYSGEYNRATGSISPAVQESVTVQRPSKTAATTSGSPSPLGQPVTFTARVTSAYGSIPDGEPVRFYDGRTAIGTSVTASGMAEFTTSALTAKTHSIKAIYAGDANFKASSALVTQVVAKQATTATLSSNANPSVYKQAVTFTATVTAAGPTPTGKVKFMDGTTWLNTAAMSGGAVTFTTSKLAVGAHPITAQYLGMQTAQRARLP